MSDEKNTEAQQPEPQGVAGVGLLLAAFHTEDAGEKALKAMKQARKEGKFYYEAAAVIRKDADGDVHYHETGDMSTAKGAGIGALIGGVVGVLGGPMGIALGAGAGAGIGALAARGDAGFRDSSLEQIGTALRPGSSAVLVITSEEFLKEFRKQVSDAEVWPLVRAIGESVAQAQAEGKDMLFGLVITEGGIAFKRLAFDDTTAEVFGVMVTEEGMAAGAAYADDSGIIYQVGVSDAEGTAIQTGAITEEGAVIVDETTPAGSDETTVQATVITPEADAPALEEGAAAEAQAESDDEEQSGA